MMVDYLSPAARSIENRRKAELEAAIRTRAEIERIADQRSPGRKASESKPPI
jgi:hypothetical protein